MAINGFYNITPDKRTHAPNKEKFTTCLGWMDEYLVDHEDALRLYNIGTIHAENLVKVILDVVVCRKGSSLNQC